MKKKHSKLQKTVMACINLLNKCLGVLAMECAVGETETDQITIWINIYNLEQVYEAEVPVNIRECNRASWPTSLSQRIFSLRNVFWSKYKA